jgi:1,4-alpha-glucan branching enzyme
VEGTVFCVWAPNAQRVSVVGDFNNWDGRVHTMRKLLGSGIWEIFLPGIKEGAHYKFEVKGYHGEICLKSDPFAFYGQHGLQTASIVYDLGRFAWSDESWMKYRASTSRHGNAWRRKKTVPSATSNSPNGSFPTVWKWASPTSS